MMATSNAMLRALLVIVILSFPLSIIYLKFSSQPFYITSEASLRSTYPVPENAPEHTEASLPLGQKLAQQGSLCFNSESDHGSTVNWFFVLPQLPPEDGVRSSLTLYILSQWNRIGKGILVICSKTNAQGESTIELLECANDWQSAAPCNFLDRKPSALGLPLLQPFYIAHQKKTGWLTGWLIGIVYVIINSNRPDMTEFFVVDPDKKKLWQPLPPLWEAVQPSDLEKEHAFDFDSCKDCLVLSAGWNVWIVEVASALYDSGCTAAVFSWENMRFSVQFSHRRAVQNFREIDPASECLKFIAGQM